MRPTNAELLGHGAIKVVHEQKTKSARFQEAANPKTEAAASGDGSPAGSSVALPPFHGGIVLGRFTTIEHAIISHDPNAT